MPHKKVSIILVRSLIKVWIDYDLLVMAPQLEIGSCLYMKTHKKVRRGIYLILISEWKCVAQKKQIV